MKKNNNLFCDHFFNGFRISALPHLSDDVIVGYLFYIIPKNSTVHFYFLHLNDAYSFCKQFANCHSDSFWFKLWKSNPIYHLNVVSKYVSPMSHLL